jgi:hypothetical protein
MRRLAVCAFAVLAVGLVLTSSAPASTGVGHAAGRGGHPVLRSRHVAFGAGRAAPAGPAFSRLGAAPVYDISGHVLNLAGTPVVGAEVDWGWWEREQNSTLKYVLGGSNETAVGSPGTDSTGAFAFRGVTSHSSVTPKSDDLTAWYTVPSTGSALEYLESWSNDFSTANDATTPALYSYELRPAAVNVTIANAPGAPRAEVLVAGADGKAQSKVALAGGSGLAYAPPAAFDDVVAYYYHFAGSLDYPTCLAQTEWLGASPVSVVAGATAPDTVSLDWRRAQYAYLAGPTCRHSGKPGTTVTMVLKGWPAGEISQFVGYYGPTSSYDYKPITSSGVGTRIVSLQIRPNAIVDTYDIDTYRLDATDSSVDLWDYFQVCTFNASASAIHRGKAVRLSGKVPAGAGKVVIYSRTRVAGQPATLAAKGWLKGGTYKIASGKFATGLLHPQRTTWYVAKYAGYDFPAFTSVVKVAVR